MIKKGMLIMAIALFLGGCKAKRSVAQGNGHKTGSTVKTVDAGSKETKNDGLYPLPEDTGVFYKFPIHSVEEYIDTFSEIAQMEMKAFGIPASITLAQGLLESGYGMGALAIKTNNHFGIKCHKGWDGDYDFHDDDEKGECFRKYNHPMYSFRDHSLFLTSRSRYAALFELPNTDYKGWAVGLKEAGYATDRHYPKKLIALIERHQLYRFDGSPLKPSYRTATASNNYPTAVHVVQKGDTLYSISRKYLVSVEELMQLNQMKSSTLSIGQQLTVKSDKINK
jgi:hypothetical protein